MATIHPFKINISTAVLDDLQWRLQNTRGLSALKNDAGRDCGTDMNYLEELVDYWQEPGLPANDIRVFFWSFRDKT